MLGLYDVLLNISHTYQTHLLSYYVFELANNFHTYYANNRILDPQNIERTKARLCMVKLVRIVFKISLDLLGITTLEKM
jgi:arginyl-tRNA synthetase